MRFVLVPILLLVAVTASAAQTGDAPAGDDLFDLLLHWTTRAIEVAGIAVIIVGGVVSTWVYVGQMRAGAGEEAYHAYRAGVGRAILLGLEFLVAADIIGTVAIEPTLDSLAVLAGIVLIRTFLSFSLEVEIEGRLPWRKSGEQRAAEGDRRGTPSTP